MKTYTIHIELKSDALIGSGEGFGALIESDIVFDDLGIPYIPSKRIKGCLREAACEICHMLKDLGITSFMDLTANPKDESDFTILNDTFGKPGQDKPTPVYFSNLTIRDYEKEREWLEYLLHQYPSIISREGILSAFTALRQQTAIDETGIAKEHSLRTIRVIKRGLTFTGEITLKEDGERVRLLSLACLNLGSMGSKRRRGFGEVECRFFDGTKNVSILDEPVAECRV